MKKKLTAAEFKKLKKDKPAVAELYKEDEEGGGAVLDLEDDDPADDPNTPEAGKRALLAEREKVRKLKEKLDAADAAKLAAEEAAEDAAAEAASKKGDVAAAVAAVEKKHARELAKVTGQLDSSKKHLNTLLVDSKAAELASKLATKGDEHLLLPFIKERLAVDLDGEEPATIVLGADRKASALSLDDLSKEIVADARFKRILAAPSGSGGGAGGPSSDGSAFDGKSYKKPDGTTDWNKVSEAAKTNPGIVQQMQDFNSDPANSAPPAASSATV